MADKFNGAILYFVSTYRDVTVFECREEQTKKNDHRSKHENFFANFATKHDRDVYKLPVGRT